MPRGHALPLFALAALLSPAPGGAAGRLEVLASDATGVDLQWTLDRTELETVSGVDRTFRRPAYAGGLYLAEPGAPDLPSIVELVGVPLEGEPRIRVMSVDPSTMPVPDLAPAPTPIVRTGRGGAPFGAEERRQVEPFPRGSTPSRWAEIDGVVHVRGHRLARVVLHPWRYDASRGELEWARRLRVRVEFEEGAVVRGEEAADHAEWDRMLDRLILNADAARRWRRPAAHPDARTGTDSFESSPNWLKVPIVTEGVYRIDYSTFADLGFNPGEIDPQTIRVFSGTNMMIPDALTELPLGFMSECALLDVSALPDPIFDVEDRLLFYALDATGWGSEYDPSLPHDRHVENQYTDVTYYWITWGDEGKGFTNPPARMTTRSVPPTGGPYDTTATYRAHFEENNVEDFRYRDEDGWMWEDLRGRGTDRPYFLSIDGVAPGGTGRLIGRMLSWGEFGGDDRRHVQLKVRNTVVAERTWLHTSQSAISDVTGGLAPGSLQEGSNRVLVNVITTDPGSSDRVYTAWFELEYERRLEARNGSYVKMWAPPASGPWELRDFSSNDVHLLDVSDQHAVVRLQDFAVQAAGPLPHQVRFSDPETTTAHWYVAFTMESVRTLPVPDIEITSFQGGDDDRSLRNSANGAEYVIIYHPAFREGAERLAQLRAQDTVSDSSRDVMAVSLTDVYNEFSWGMVDAVAIRDFLAFTRVGWANGSPLWVTLIGDAAYDLKGFLDGSPESFVPPYVNRYRTETLSEYVAGFNLNFYSTDDFFAYLEVEDYSGSGQPAMDLAIGRYAVWSAEGLDVQLDKLESYLDYSEPGQWQNRVIMAADDERVLAGIDFTKHTDQVEELAQTWLPPALDRVKVYLTEYPRDDFGKKPLAQADFTDEYTRGALMVTYTGHGDQNTLAQEEVFVSQKMSELLNEERFPVFSTFSCTVSRFDLLSGDSMTELMLLHEGGGTVSTFSSGGLVFPAESSTLNKRWLGQMFGTPYVVHTFSRDVRSIGEAAWTAKVYTGGGAPSRRINNEKYVVLGDPALRVRFGRYLVEFEPGTVDSQATDGLLRLVSGDVKNKFGEVLDGTSGEPAFQGTAFIHVTENADTSGYRYPGGEDSLSYKLDGPTSYRGEVPVVNGHFDARFFLSETVTIGNRGRISVFALEHDLARDASGAHDSLVIAPTISPQDTDDSEGPVVRIGFEGYEGFVDGGLLFTDQPILDIALEDPSGINLRPVPQFAVLGAQIDGLDQVDLSEDFSYEAGSYTKGRVRRILPLPVGSHTVVVKAFDNVANRGSASVRFEIVAPGSDFDLDAATVAAYPNPFQHQVHFVFRMTAEAEVTLKIFTITGRKVFEEAFGENLFAGSPQSGFSIPWNGQDQDGTPLANGTYLYKLEATHRAASGESQRDEFVGKVVKMQ
jgi:hypothetical protein